MISIYTHFGVPILQSPGEPERAGEARRADSASYLQEAMDSSACPNMSQMTITQLQ